MNSGEMRMKKRIRTKTIALTLLLSLGLSIFVTGTVNGKPLEGEPNWLRAVDPDNTVTPDETHDENVAEENQEKSEQKSHPMSTDLENSGEDSSEKIVDTDQMLEKMAEEYLSKMETHYSMGFSLEYALVPITDSPYPELVIWDHDESVLYIYKIDERENCVSCGRIELPKYDGFYWGCQYRVHYHEKKGLIDVEVRDDMISQYDYTVYSIGVFSDDSAMDNMEQVPVLWSGKEVRDITASGSGSSSSFTYSTAQDDSITAEEFREDKERYFLSEDRKLLCGQTMGEGFSWYDATDSDVDFTLYPSMVGYLRSLCVSDDNTEVILNESLWSTIYLGYFNCFLEKYHYDKFRYDQAELLYLDDDDVPEILLHSGGIIKDLGDVVLDDVMLSINGTDIVEQKLSYYWDLSYIPRENKLLARYGEEGLSVERVFSLEDGMEKELFYGERSGDIIDKPERFTKEEYDASINKVFDRSEAVKVTYDHSIIGLREELRSLLHKSFQEKEDNWVNAYQKKLLSIFAGDEYLSGGIDAWTYNCFDLSMDSPLFQLMDMTGDGIPELILDNGYGGKKVYSYDKTSGLRLSISNLLAYDTKENLIYSYDDGDDWTPYHKKVFSVKNGNIVFDHEIVFAYRENEHADNDNPDDYYIPYYYTRCDEEEKVEITETEWRELSDEFDEKVRENAIDDNESIILSLKSIDELSKNTLFPVQSDDYRQEPQNTDTDLDVEQESWITETENEEASEIKEMDWKKQYLDYLNEFMSDSTNRLAIIDSSDHAAPIIAILEEGESSKFSIISIQGEEIFKTIFFGEKIAYIPERDLIHFTKVADDLAASGYSEQILSFSEGSFSYLFSGSYKTNDEIMEDENAEQEYYDFSVSANSGGIDGYVSKEEYDSLFNSVYDRNREISIDTWYTLDGIMEMLKTPGMMAPPESAIFDDLSKENSEGSGEDESSYTVFDAFLNNEIYAYYPENFEYPGDPFKYEDRYHGEDDIDSLKASGRIDVNNDGKKDLILEDYYGETYICENDGKLYVLAEPNGTAVRTSHTYYDGAEWIVTMDVGHAGRESYYLTKYNGDGEVVDEFELSAEYWDSLDDRYDENSDFSYRGESITMQEFEKLRDEIFRTGEPHENENVSDNSETKGDTEQNNENWKAAYEAYINDFIAKYNGDELIPGYLWHDLNNDGIPELFINHNNDGIKIFGYHDGADKVVLLMDNVGNHMSGQFEIRAIKGTPCFLLGPDSSQEISLYTIKDYNTVKLLVFSVSEDCIFKDGSGRKISQKDFITKFEEYTGIRWEADFPLENGETGLEEHLSKNLAKAEKYTKIGTEKDTAFPAWDLDMDAEVEKIHEWNEEMLENRTNYDFHNMGEYSCYSIGTDPVYIIAKSGYNDWEPTRYYYGYSIFYVEVEYSPKKVRKYYYSGYRLFRVETEVGKVIEYGDKDWEKYDEEGKRLEEERSALEADLRKRLE